MSPPTTADAAARIVIVDDEPLNVRLLERAIQRAGIGAPEGFTDPVVAVASIRERQPDLVLLDVHMPVMDGFAALEAIRTGLPSDTYLPVVFLTGDADREIRTRALASGARDFLTKPFDLDEVVLRSKNLLETRRLHLELRRRNAELMSEVRERTLELEIAQQDRMAVATALSRPRQIASPEEAAMMLCSEIADLRDVTGAALVVFGPGGTAAPLAVSGQTGEPLPVGRNIGSARATLLRQRSTNGPWTEETSDGAARVIAPLHAGRDTVGVLSVATRRPLDAAWLATLLPTAVEYAALAGAVLGPELLNRQREVDLRETIDAIVRRQAFAPVFQPIVDLETGRTLGHEALTRFADGERPERRFADAEAVGLGVDLELACLGAALRDARSLPGGWISLNVSPDLVLLPDRLGEVLRDPPHQVVLEITEHVPVTDYRAFREAIGTLGEGIQFAIDDAGAGFSSFRHIVELTPHFVKLDIGLVRAIDRDPVRQALVSGMDFFALKTGCRLIAEGVETDGERDTLRSLAVEMGQGLLLGPPTAARS